MLGQSNVSTMFPSDLPRFPKLKFRAATDKIRVCVKASSPDSSFQLFVNAVQKLRRVNDNISIRIMGTGRETTKYPLPLIPYQI